MLRGSILQHSKLECPARLASCLCTLCFWTKLNFNRGGDPPSGGREGEKGKGGRAEGTCPGGPLRAAHPLPSLLPPWVPFAFAIGEWANNPTGNPSLCFFSSSSFYFFGSTCHQLHDCCLSTFYFLLSPTFHFLSTCCFSQKLASCSCPLAFLKCSII